MSADLEAIDSRAATPPQRHDRPRLSIGLPVYNGERYLDRCIASIVAQTFTDFELLVCDNASSDRTPRIALDWCRRDPRILYHRADTNRGAAHNFNWAVDLARGELFKWCAVDDLIAPRFLESCIAALDARPDAVLAYSGALDVDPHGTVIAEIYDNRAPLRFGADDVATRFHDLALTGHSCISVFGVVRTAALRRSARIGPYPGSDHVLLVELGLRGPFVRVAGDLLFHRQHPERSVTRHPRLRDRVHWFTGRRTRFSFPNFRMYAGYVVSMMRTPMTTSQRWRCMRSLLQWIYWGGWRKLLADLRDNVR